MRAISAFSRIVAMRSRTCTVGARSMSAGFLEQRDTLPAIHQETRPRVLRLKK
jgi:hypothetical protein